MPYRQEAKPQSTHNLHKIEWYSVNFPGVGGNEREGKQGISGSQNCFLSPVPGVLFRYFDMLFLPIICSF